jgi:hypothetical protein
VRGRVGALALIRPEEDPARQRSYDVPVLAFADGQETTMMNFAALCSLGSVVSLAFGLAFLLAPGATLALYGLVSSEPGLPLMGRFFGSALLGVGLVMGSLRPLTDGTVQRGVGIAQVAYCVVGALVSVYGTLSGAMNGMGWSAVAIYVFFALAWAPHALGRAGSARTLAH